MIDTARLHLRPFSSGDRDQLLALLSDPAVMRYSVSGPKSHDEILDGLVDWTRTHRSGRPERWAVITRTEREFIGFCGFSFHPVNGEWVWELGYRLLPETWGRGFATEAAAACRDWFFNSTGEDRFVLMIDPDNVASGRVAEKIGARYEFDADCYGVKVRIYVVRRP